ncbi:MAG: hypothetical protein FD174_3920 [Geobacteraceae bacterium]|nr:MAG: hypothetical protein FD174_3920 [Geobacteraceae bacterium]
MAKITVETEISSDPTADERPLSFTLAGRTFLVRELLDRWDGADCTYFKLVASDGNLYIIRHDMEEDAWEMVMMETL